VRSVCYKFGKDPLNSILRYLAYKKGIHRHTDRQTVTTEYVISRRSTIGYWHKEWSQFVKTWRGHHEVSATTAYIEDQDDDRDQDGDYKTTTETKTAALGLKSRQM